MSFGIQIAQSAITMGETAGISEEVIDSQLPDNQGQLKTDTKNYVFTQTFSKMVTHRLHTYMQRSGPYPGIKSSDNSPMCLAKSIYQTPMRSVSTPSSDKTVLQPFTLSSSYPKETLSRTTTNSAEHSKNDSQLIKTLETKSFDSGHSKNVQAPRRAAHASGQKRAERGENRQDFSSIQARKWSKEETVAWWELRYHQKERDGHKQGQDRHQEENLADQKEKQKKKSVNAVAASSASTTTIFYEANEKTILFKPALERPKTGVFALYYILTKIGILSDGVANFSYKKEIETVDADTVQAHQKRLNELKIAIEKEQSAARWGVATKVFSWIGSMVGIVTGIALIATGVGVVAGALLIVGSIIQITNQILELTGGWHKIAELLPGNDPEKKRAVVAWMQIGIAVLCLILSAAGVIFGGYASFGEATQTAMAVFGGIAAMGHGTTTIGEGIVGFMSKDKMGEVKRYDKILAELKHRRRDLMERVDWGMDRLQQLFEDLAKTLEFEVELFKADQMVNR